jgi:hypothetical protein
MVHSQLPGSTYLSRSLWLPGSTIQHKLRFDGKEKIYNDTIGKNSTIHVPEKLVICKYEAI